MMPLVYQESTLQAFITKSIMTTYYRKRRRLLVIDNAAYIKVVSGILSLMLVDR